MKVGLYYFRSLYTQSAASLSVGKLSAVFLQQGYDTHIGLLKKDDYAANLQEIKTMLEEDVIIYKCNFKDFEYGISLFKEFYMHNPNKTILLTGPFAVLNKTRIKKKYKFVKNIFDCQTISVNDIPFCGSQVRKESLIANIDREIELKEEGSYINIEFSTGCIYKCEFCHNNILKWTYTEKTAETLVDEIEILISKGKRFFIFNDCIFWKNAADTKRILSFCQEIEKRKLQISFYVYQSVAAKIPDELFEKLKQIGLVRVFFGIENVSADFAKNYSKYVSTSSANKLIDKLNYDNISYHIGFILFYKQTTKKELLENLKYLHQIRKLFRVGIIVEKMRILPKSKLFKCVNNDGEKVDLAYNYNFDNDEINGLYGLFCDFFSKINIRNFEQFFNSISLAKALLYRYNCFKQYNLLFRATEDLITEVNDFILNALTDIVHNNSINEKLRCKLQEIYHKSEFNYYVFMSELQTKNSEIAKMIPHGREELNI